MVEVNVGKRRTIVAGLSVFPAGEILTFKRETCQDVMSNAHLLSSPLLWHTQESPNESSGIIHADVQLSQRMTRG
jgi:hypothetical protein